jgi:hypothetical protein
VSRHRGTSGRSGCSRNAMPTTPNRNEGRSSSSDRSGTACWRTPESGEVVLDVGAGDGLIAFGAIVGVRNSDHPCDLRLRPSWPRAKDGTIRAVSRARAGHMPANRTWMKSESDALRSSPGGSACRRPQGKATEAGCSRPWRPTEVLARLRRGVAKPQVKLLIGVSDPYKFDEHGVALEASVAWSRVWALPAPVKIGYLWLRLRTSRAS